jgi:7,8-didemethyl-8-hydroxy-5-deazariboflavin synthase CofG subunit
LSIKSFSDDSRSSCSSVNAALSFLQSDDSQTLEKWKKSAQNISKKITHHNITFTTNVFLPLTFLCRNTCTYCNFRLASVSKGEEYLDISKIDSLLVKAKKFRVSEVLITMGEKPEEGNPEAKKWLHKHGFDSTIDYTYFIAQKALEFGLLPHINAGSLKLEEFSYLREVAASMGLMLENISSRMTHIGMPHHQSPDKAPHKRINALKHAGELKIPFTSGILIGIGETQKEIVSSLFFLRNLFKKYRHLQEIIIQNYQPKLNGKTVNNHLISLNLLEKVVIVARHILPPEISIQIPPNLILADYTKFVNSGVSDWGGISPITPDYINPEHSWPTKGQLEKVTEEQGYNLIERLPVYPHFIQQDWLSQKIYEVIKSENLATEDGYRNK